MACYSDLKGHSAIVTGADSRIGDAVVRELEAQKMWVTAVPAELPTEEATLSASALADKVRDHLTDVDTVSRTCSQVVGKYGGIDLLVHCAGAQPAVDGPQITDISDERWRGAVVSTMRGAFLWSQGVLRHMVARRRGCVVFIAAEAARNPTYAAGIDYASTRGALTGLARHLAREMGPHGIRVNVVAVADAAAAGVSSLPRLPAYLSWATPPASPAEAARLVAFLASGAAAYITGVCLDAFR
ncbi:MAG: SDR family oxidoreductase [Armatimonadetes bacterium]|nr:SDR family oxidoreductase [Armatimonadota bacterium]